jgi:hypothetical protein
MSDRGFEKCDPGWWGVTAAMERAESQRPSPSISTAVDGAPISLRSLHDSCAARGCSGEEPGCTTG